MYKPTETQQARWQSVDQAYQALAEATAEKIRRRGAIARPPVSAMQTEPPLSQAATANASGPCPTCLDMKLVTMDLPVEHQDFGKAFPCPTCQQPQLARAAKRAEQEKINTLIASSGLSKHHLYTFEDFWALSDGMRAGKEDAAHICQSLAEQFEVCLDVCRPGVCLHGVYGTGKTTLATAALLYVAKRGVAVLSVKYPDFLDDVQNTYGRKGEGPSADDVIRAAQEAPFVLLDDMGDPSPAAKEMSPDKRRITHRLLEYRLEHELPTLITTNCTVAQLAFQLTEKTKQRVTELCHWVEVKGDPLRNESIGAE